MTLKETLRQNLTGHLSDEKTEVDINIAERIADDYAIEFAEWYRVKCILSSLDYHLTTKELLEIFKKERGL